MCIGTVKIVVKIILKTTTIPGERIDKISELHKNVIIIIIMAIQTQTHLSEEISILCAKREQKIPSMAIKNPSGNICSFIN